MRKDIFVKKWYKIDFFLIRDVRINGILFLNCWGKGIVNLEFYIY